MTVPNKNGEKKQFQRLPGYVKPYNYDINLKLDPVKLDFVGEHKIYVNVSQ